MSLQPSSFYPPCVNLSHLSKSFLIAGEYHLYVEDIQFDRFNEFECQVSPDHQNQHEALRARAFLNVLGRYPHYPPGIEVFCKVSASQQLCSNININKIRNYANACEIVVVVVAIMLV